MKNPSLFHYYFVISNPGARNIAIASMKITITLLLLLLATTSFAQPSTPKEELYNILRTHKIIPSPHKETAKKDLEDYISKYPKNPYSLIARYWLGEILRNLNDVDGSKLYYIQAIAIPAPDSVFEANFYRHGSAIRLAEISIARGDYSAALNYLDLAKHKFILRPGCGKPKIDHDIGIKVMYSSCYIELGNSRDAIDLLAPYMFGMYRGDTTVSNKLYEAYLKIHTKEEIKNEFLNAEKTLEIEEKQIDGFYLLQPTLSLFGKTITFDVWHFNVKKLTEQGRKQKCMETIRQSAIYKLTTQ